MNQNDEKEKNSSFINIDSYGIKLNAIPGDLGEPPPKSWKDVLSQVNGHLMRIFSGVTRLVAETLEGSIRIVRGTSNLPNSISERISLAHKEADKREINSQKNISNLLISNNEKSLSSEEKMMIKSDLASQNVMSVDKINSLLQKFRDKGFNGYFYFLIDGKLVFIYGISSNCEGQVREILSRITNIEENKLIFPPKDEG